LSRLKSLKLAIPEAAFFVVVPPRVAPLGFDPMERVMGAVEELTTFPRLSCIVMVGGPAIVLPAVAAPGWAANTRLLGTPGVTLKALLSPAVSVSPLV
jgi:hypothetical protein